MILSFRKCQSNTSGDLNHPLRKTRTSSQNLLNKLWYRWMTETSSVIFAVSLWYTADFCGHHIPLFWCANAHCIENSSWVMGQNRREHLVSLDWWHTSPRDSVLICSPRLSGNNLHDLWWPIWNVRKFLCQQWCIVLTAVVMAASSIFHPGGSVSMEAKQRQLRCFQ